MAVNNHQIRRCLSLSNLSKREWTLAAAAALSVFLFILFSPFSLNRTTLIKDTTVATDSNTSFLDSSSDWVPFTPLSKAKDNSAFCLDGSVPGYHIQNGFGSGANSWLLHVEGGGWCSNMATCSARQRMKLGSSNYMEREVEFLGILSHDPLQNPDFYNWNKVKLRYCDGSSFASHPDNESKSATKIFFRGQLIWKTIMDELLSIGMSKAKEALLTGCSAGGLATLIHCDAFRDLLPNDVNVKCLADAGFFLNEKDIAGNGAIESFYENVVQLQSVAKSLNNDCVAKSKHSKCFFAEEFIGSIKTPIFLVQPAYDFWQIANILVPEAADTNHSWHKCKLNIFDCDPKQLEVLHGYRNSLLKTLGEFEKNVEGGFFVNSCFVHCQTWVAETWHSPTSPRINNKTVAEAVGDWYFKRAEAKHIDCQFPCNPTCYHRDLNLV